MSQVPAPFQPRGPIFETITCIVKPHLKQEEYSMLVIMFSMMFWTDLYHEY